MRVRLFVPEPIREGKPLDLSAQQAHYLARVLRLRPESRVVVFDGTGGEWEAVLASVSPHKAQALPVRFCAVDREPRVRLVLLQALVKGEKADWIVQKATEIGAAAVVFFPAARSVARWKQARVPHKIERLERIAIEAAEQSGRTRVPTVAFAEALEALPALEAGFVLDPSGVLPQALRAHWAQASEVGLAVGPEGGFTEEELARLRARGFQPMRLGARILRTETAGVVGLATLLALHPRGIGAEAPEG